MSDRLIVAESAMLRARRIPDVGTRRVFPMLVRERSGEHQKLLTERMFVRSERLSGRVPHDARRPCNLVTYSVEQLALDTLLRRRDPRCNLAFYHHAGAEVCVHGHVYPRFKKG